MKNLFDLLQKIREEEFANITYFAEMDEKNTKFKDFEYFTIEKDNLLFYIEKTSPTLWASGIMDTYSITTYEKVNCYTKQQISYPKGFNTYEELKSIVNEEIIIFAFNHHLTIPKTNKQNIYYELNQYVKTSFGNITILNYLKKIAGFREKEILKNLDKITMNLNNNKYLILEFHNKEGQSFAINTKNIDRLIVA